MVLLLMKDTPRGRRNRVVAPGYPVPPDPVTTRSAGHMLPTEVTDGAPSFWREPISLSRLLDAGGPLPSGRFTARQARDHPANYWM